MLFLCSSGNLSYSSSAKHAHTHTQQQQQLDQVYEMFTGHRWTVEVTAALCMKFSGVHINRFNQYVDKSTLKINQSPKHNITLCLCLMKLHVQALHLCILQTHLSKPTYVALKLRF